MNLGLEGKSVLITGATKGIGLACETAFAQEQARLTLVARSADALEEVAVLLRRDGRDVRVIAADLGEPGAAQAIADVTGTVDVLVNNAGAIPAGDIFAVDDATWRAAWDLKVFGYIAMTRAYYDLMRKAGEGTIVNVIGVAAQKLDPRYVCGSTGNAALDAFTRAIGSTSIDHGVRIVGINPGGVETERMIALLRSRAEAEFGDADKWRVYLEQLPQKRGARAEEVADAVVWLSSSRASYISGTVVACDGGFAHR